MPKKKPSAHPQSMPIEPIHPETAEQAFLATKAEIEAVPPDELVAINVDVSSACTTGLGTADRIEPLLDELLTLPNFNRETVMTLRRRAMAALFANAALV